MIRGICIALVWVFAAAFCALAEIPELLPGTPILDGAAFLTVDSGLSIPEVADWNNDGKKDLLVGQYAGGKIRLFLNQGSSSNPVFNGSSFIRSGGADIITDYG